jgi:hypothetical protein
MGENRPGMERARVLLLGILLALASCGDVSLKDALQGDSPGELRFSPSAALVPLGSDFTFSVMGGIFPYNIVSGTVTPRDDHTWVFPAQTAITGDTEDFLIQASDLLGNTASAVVTVYSVSLPLALNVTAVTLMEGDSWTFVVSGGKPSYTWSLNDVPVDPPPAPDDSFTYLFSSAGSYTVSVTDSIGASQAATVTVVPFVASAPLAITPTAATVAVNGTAYFTALGGSGSYTFMVSGGGTITATANPATYTAPGSAGPRTVSLSDDGGATFPVAATVTVVPLAQSVVLSPDSPTVSAIYDTIQFTVTGGTAPYTFSTNNEARGYIDPTTGFYTQLQAGNVVVTVRASTGLSDNTLVKFK